MRIILGLPRKEKLRENELLKVGWKKTEILSDMTMLIIQSVPLMALGALIPFVIFNSFGEFVVSVTNVELVVAVIIGLILHESLHLLGIPKLTKAKNLTLGIYSGGTYSYFDEVMTKTRYLTITCIPFFFLSVIMPLYAAMAQYYSSILFVVALFNGVTSALDFHTFFKVLIKVPRKSNITTNGMEIFFYKK